MTTPLDVRGIPLRNRSGQIVAWAIVDAEDFERLNCYRWSLDGHATRVQRGEYDPATQKTRQIRMHRQVVGLVPGDGLEADHINRNPLDNRKANLEIVNHAQNRQNNGANRNSTSGIRGVGWDAARGKWRAQVTLNYRNYGLGRFDSKEEARLVVEAFRAKHMPYSDEGRRNG